MRIWALPTRSRTTRGRRGDRLFRTGRMAQETNNYVLQICPRAHKARIDRHDAVLSSLGRNLRCQGFEVQEEPHYSTQELLRKPDIVAIMGTLELEPGLLKSKSTPTILTSNGPYSEKPEQPTSVTYRSSSPGGVSVQNISIRFSDTGHHHPKRSRCHRHPCAHRWYHRQPRLQSFNLFNVRKMTSPKKKTTIPFPRCCLPFSATIYFKKSGLWANLWNFWIFKFTFFRFENVIILTLICTFRI